MFSGKTAFGIHCFRADSYELIFSLTNELCTCVLLLLLLLCVIISFSSERGRLSAHPFLITDLRVPEFRGGKRQRDKN